MTPAESLREWLLSLRLPLAATTIRFRVAASLTFLLTAITRFVAASRTLWDWDEVLFAIALGEYDVPAHRPHPPGFPVYVGLGKLARLFIGDDFLALRAVNLTCGVLLAPALYFLGRELRLPARTALAAAAIISFFPPIWLFGGTAFSDVPSLVFITLGCALLLRGIRDPWALLAGALVTAAAVGVRTQNVLNAALPLLLVVTVRPFRYWRSLVLATLLGCAVAGSAYGVAVHASGGWQSYREAVTVHRKFIAANDAVGAPNRPALDAVAELVFVRPIRAGKLTLPLFLLSVAGIALALWRRHFGVLTATIIYAPMTLIALFMLDPHSLGRFSLSFLPLYGFLIATTFHELAERLHHALLPGLVVTTTGLLLAWGWAPASTLRTTISPPVAAAAWINANVPAWSAKVLVTPRLVPHAEYFLTNYTLVKIPDDPPPLATSEAAWLLNDGAAYSRDQHWFRRDHDRLWHVMRRYNFDVSVTEASNIPEFVEGWYDGEQGEFDQWRWMRARGVIQLAPLGGVGRISLRLLVPVADLRTRPTIVVLFNGNEIARVAAVQEVVEIERTVAARSDAMNVLELHTSETVNYAKRGMGEDSRELGVRLFSLDWRK